MGLFLQIIPLVEITLILAVLGLGGLGYLSLRNNTDQFSQYQQVPVGKFILWGLICLAIPAILLFCLVSLVN